MASLRDRTNVASTSVRSQVTSTRADVASVSVVTPPSEREEWASPTADPLVPFSLKEMDLATVLHALSDPVRLLIVSQLSDGSEHTCGSLQVPVAKSTSSHHFRVLREAGVLAQRLDGKCRYNRLRTDELEQSFPGLLDAVLRAQGPLPTAPKQA